MFTDYCWTNLQDVPVWTLFQSTPITTGNMIMWGLKAENRLIAGSLLQLGTTEYPFEYKLFTLLPLLAFTSPSLKAPFQSPETMEANYRHFSFTIKSPIKTMPVCTNLFDFCDCKSMVPGVVSEMTRKEAPGGSVLNGNWPLPNSTLKLRPRLISHQRASNKSVKSLNRCFQS